MQFYFQAAVEGNQQTLALCSLYSPADDFYREYSNNALNVCTYVGQERLVVIPVDTILSVVAMIPFGEQDGQTRSFFLVEKFALGVIDSGDDEDLD